jgi:signal transduction histidine kinase
LHVPGTDFLRRLPLFSDLSETDLERLHDMASRLTVPEGERFIEEGTAGDALYVIIDGEVEITHRERSREVVLATRESGEFIGEMSLLEDAPRSASARALRETELLVIRRAAFQTLLSCSPSAPLTILRTVTSRLRSTESLLMQQQKLAALGTMAAGLAHELNNPAAAIQRSSAHLREALTEWGRATTALGALSPDDLMVLNEIHRGLEAPPTASATDALARTAQEDEVQGWLDEQGTERSWEMAPVLVAAGWDRSRLAVLGERLPGIPVAALMGWLGAGAAVYGLVNEVGQSAHAISEIVRAAKTYSYLDQAPVQEVDVHESLESTLVILRHKLKEGISVERDYASDRLRIEAYGSELNQAWTNLIDNAVDAMGGRGELRLRTYAKGDTVVVEIKDDGPGIPEEVQARLFEPFFTTKPPGQGTGLGLHLVYNTIVQRHNGQIRVFSQPGATCFQVTLPVRLARG